MSAGWQALRKRDAAAGFALLDRNCCKCWTSLDQPSTPCCHKRVLLYFLAFLTLHSFWEMQHCSSLYRTIQLLLQFWKQSRRILRSSHLRGRRTLAPGEEAPPGQLLQVFEPTLLEGCPLLSGLFLRSMRNSSLLQLHSWLPLWVLASASSQNTKVWLLLGKVITFYIIKALETLSSPLLIPKKLLWPVFYTSLKTQSQAEHRWAGKSPCWVLLAYTDSTPKKGFHLLDVFSLCGFYSKAP